MGGLAKCVRLSALSNQSMYIDGGRLGAMKIMALTWQGIQCRARNCGLRNRFLALSIHSFIEGLCDKSTTPDLYLETGCANSWRCCTVHVGAQAAFSQGEHSRARTRVRPDYLRVSLLTTHILRLAELRPLC